MDLTHAAPIVGWILIGASPSLLFFGGIRIAFASAFLGCTAIVLFGSELTQTGLERSILIGVVFAAILLIRKPFFRKNPRSDVIEPVHEPISQYKDFHPTHYNGRRITKLPEGINVHLDYADADGVVTSRFVTVSGYSSGGAMMHGHCHLRNDYRTFSLDRVLHIATESGEISPEDFVTIYLKPPVPRRRKIPTS